MSWQALLHDIVRTGNEGVVRPSLWARTHGVPIETINEEIAKARLETNDIEALKRREAEED